MNIQSSACNCINIRRAASAVTEHYDRLLRPSGLTVNQYSLLKNLSALHSCSISELARVVRLERTTLVRGLKPLFMAGYILDAAAPGSRDRQLTLTEAGHSVLQTAIPLWKQAQRDIEEQIGRENLRLLTEWLTILEQMA